MFEKAETKNIDNKKARILEIIKEKGPSLPVQISREMGMSPILVSAIIAEMRDHDLLKLSSLKVGGSPLYFLKGQEEQLDNFAKFLPQKEKETFELLKKAQVLEDEKIMPAERVALRSMKDFAVPIKVSDLSGEKIFWHFHTFPEQEAMKKIHELLKFEKSVKATNLRTKEKIEKIEENIGNAISDEGEPGKEIEKRKAKKKDQIAFINKIKEYLESKNITIEKINEGKDFSAVVSLNSDIGSLKFLAIAKNKKKPSITDILLTQQQVQQTGLPVLFLVNELPKQQTNSLIIFKKLD